MKDYYRPFSRNGYSAMTGIRELILERLRVLIGVPGISGWHFIETA
jgi:hypothetical protein